LTGASDQKTLAVENASIELTYKTADYFMHAQIMKEALYILYSRQLPPRK